MNIRPQYQQRYLYNMAVDQLVADYQERGYQVDREKKIGDYLADLIATKGDEVIVVEVKAGSITPQKRKQLVQIGDYVRTRKNHKFLVVVAIPPKKKKIAIPELNQLLFQYVGQHIPENFNVLSPYPRITKVSETVVSELTINKDGSMVASGTGIITAEFLYGNSDKQSIDIEDVFPFDFDVVLQYNDNHELTLAKADIHVDVSSYDD